MAISIVLVLAAISTAVITAGVSSGERAKASTAGAPGAPTPPTAPAGGASGAAPPAAGTSGAPAASAPAAAPGGGQPATSPSPAPASSGAGAVSTLKLAANAGGLLSFEPKQLSAKAGKISITLSNASPLEHDVVIAQGSSVLGSTPTFKGGSKTLTLTLKPGSYTFYCSVPGHRQAGMEGTLSVT